MNHNENVQQQDDGWISRARAGDAAAFGNLVRRYSPALLRTISRMTADQAEAEAVVQDAWLRAWRALPGYKTGRPFLPWILKIAVNRCRDLWRKQQPLAFSDATIDEGSVPADAGSLEQMLINDQALEQLARGVAGLRPEYRAVIALRYEGGLQYQEISENLGIPLNTVRTYLRRARMELLAWMEVQDE